MVGVPVVGDAVDENDEAFRLNLSGAVNATIADGQGIGAIVDDDTALISVGDAVIAEGDAGTANATFTVSLDTPSTKTVTVHAATADGTAVSPVDYSSTSIDLSFSPGQTSKTADVPVAGDTLDEADETFSITLSSPANALLGDAQGEGTITDDDAAPALSANDPTVTEGDSGSTSMTFTVTLGGPSGKTVTVHYATADGSAQAPADYESATGDLTFTPGMTSRPVTVVVGTDTVLEPDETLTLSLSLPVNAVIADGSGLGTISNDDTVPAISIDDVAVTEGTGGTNTAEFTLTLTGASALPASVDWTTADGAASAGEDYERSEERRVGKECRL